MLQKWDFAVIGGGASGIAAAISAAKVGDRVVLLEKSSALGRKISASGNGRCNLMNNGKPVYYGEPSFVLEAFKHLSPNDLKLFWHTAGIILKEEDEGRIYPCTFHSSTVLEALKTNLHLLDVDIRLQTSVISINKRNNLFFLVTDSGLFTADRILIATGGTASPRLGGVDSGYHFLRSFGHRILPVFPALCPLVSDNLSISGLSGIRVRCALSLFDKKKNMLFKTKGEVLFTDYGISGICSMQCARFINDESYYIELDLISHLFPEENLILDELTFRRNRFSDLPPEYLLNGILVPKLSFAVLKQAQITLRGRKTGDLTDNELRLIALHLHCYSLQIKGTRGFENAQVTAGGACCSEFDPSNMESYIVKGLHASGEVLNIDGDCGGYNLMFAFISGILAGSNGRINRKGETI